VYGALVWEKQLNVESPKVSINLESINGMTTGIYFIKILGDDGEQNVLRFVKR
jgi:hypothetical protein